MRTTHMCVNIRGFLHHEKNMDGVMTDSEGRPMSDYEAREFLFDEIAKGRKVIPMGEPCEGFDYSGGGCPGHEQDDTGARQPK